MIDGFSSAEEAVAGAAGPRPTRRLSVTNRNLDDPVASAVVNSRVSPDDVRIIERTAMASRALQALTHKEWEVVTRHYGFHTGYPMPLTEVADDLEMSYNAVQKTHGRAMRKMREALRVKIRGLKR